MKKINLSPSSNPFSKMLLMSVFYTIPQSPPETQGSFVDITDDACQQRLVNTAFFFFFFLVCLSFQIPMSIASALELIEKSQFLQTPVRIMRVRWSFLQGFPASKCIQRRVTLLEQKFTYVLCQKSGGWFADSSPLMLLRVKEGLSMFLNL